jgi:hypothetical protein
MRVTMNTETKHCFILFIVTDVLFGLRIFNVYGCSLQLVQCFQADVRIESEPFSMDADLKHPIAAIIRAASVGTTVHSTNDDKCSSLQ